MMNRRGFLGALLALPIVVRAEIRRRRMADYINAQLSEIAAPYTKDSDPPVQWDEFQRLNTALPTYDGMARFSTVEPPFYQTIVLKPGEVVMTRRTAGRADN